MKTHALAVASLTLVAVGAVSLCLGPVTTPVRDVVAALTALATGREQSAAEILITQIRLPRILTCALVGGALAVGGAAMQAVFRNPLAEPGITGVGAGAACVAVATIVTGLAATHPVLMSLGAFAGALLATFLVQAVGSRGSNATLLLVGVALNSFLGAVIAAMVANARDSEDARSAVFWLNGDLTGSTFANVALVVGPVLLGSAGVVIHARELNLFALGEATAQSSGVAVKRVSHTVLACAALATAGAVATTGVISFVGLVVPHLIRLVAGADHRFLLPASFLVGASFLIVADTAARMLFNPVILQTGVITALIGAPFLLFLVLRGGRTV
ncbi:FecCD family ABC transporter permease [Corynebacterium sp.]|uniref:FecCD family ABC transporter permease n=1 Tax=Corynebacterium sp. TaxID=1720 RepID=UPI002A91C777|nr:iron chelate uptake ABC transporter family permease subunit [Corynebacterium sp.]MDY5786226.1 iron chelate uptake ABC transporter family permease subunit [Corynebacterium sp.]